MLVALALASSLFAELVDPRPPAEDCYRFPALDVTVRCKMAAHECGNWAQHRWPMESWRSEYWKLMRQECAWRWNAWHLLEAVHLAHPQHRRAALLQLKKHIGPDYYYSGVMPASVPLDLLDR